MKFFGFVVVTISIMVFVKGIKSRGQEKDVFKRSIIVGAITLIAGLSIWGSGSIDGSETDVNVAGEDKESGVGSNLDESQDSEIIPPTADQELTPQESVEQSVINIVDELQSTTLTRVAVNKHAGTGNPDDYIVLIYLSFDAKNRAKTAKSMIDLHNNEIGARLAAHVEVIEITTFWEVPYLKEGGNIAKANLERRGDKMVFVDTWFDGRIFEN